MGPFNTVAFFSQFVAVAGYKISYAVYVSDYTPLLAARYSTRAAGAVDLRRCGALGVWLMLLGALFALELKDGANVTSVLTAGNMVAPGSGTVVMVISCVALVTVVAVNTYGATLVSLTAVDGFRPFAAQCALTPCHRDRAREHADAAA